MAKLFLINPGTMLNTDHVSSIEMHPTGRGMVFMTNGKAYSAESNQVTELIELLTETNEEY